MRSKPVILPLFLLFALIIMQYPVLGQKVFWKEDFSRGHLPNGWKNVDVNNRGCEWIVTDQPYPGSYLYQQQAPPIASSSRGFHLQYQAGWITDEDAPRWIKKGWYPDAWIQTPAIDCSAHKAVVLQFEHTFRWQSDHAAQGFGLYAGVSADSIHWKEYDLLHDAPPASDMFIPRREVINISDVAANQPKVFIRFYWKGMLAWYWMIDDITLSEPPATDIAITALTPYTESGNDFSLLKPFVLKLKNTGYQPVQKDFRVSMSLDGGTAVYQTVKASKTPVLPFTETEVSFPAIDLSQRPSHTLRFRTYLPGDENASNDSLVMKIIPGQIELGNLTSFSRAGNTFSMEAGFSRIRLIFYSNDIFRIWVAPDGEFTNPAGNDIVVDYSDHHPRVSQADAGSYYRLSTPACVLRVYKHPLRFALYDSTNTRAVFEEVKPLTLGARSVQYLKREPGEYFYGCGMQNGYFSHRGHTILIEKGNGWDDGGRPNPAPFYMSTSGYGVFRNTWDAGAYSFMDTVQLSHNENRFDGWYFYGPSLKKILDGYTRITGRPFLPPRWAMSLGDANCYNRGKKNGKNTSGYAGTTPDVIPLVADQYVKYNMPRGWILPNDGYGCGYTQLDSVIRELHKRGFYTGLWTENGVEKIAREVGVYGSRLCKLDVAWVGAGYKFALDACKSAFEGIENNSDARGFVWSVMGWAGTQRYSVMWTGDQKGNWEYIRFHIPTVIGSGLSAQNFATGDVDGIFGGSDTTYVRDLQWKCFLPAFMSMSGWAKKDRQPYVYGEPYTSINRKYLQLKQRLTPYMYTLCYEANATGVPATRAMILEFPTDSTGLGTQTRYQFMNGPWLLVAPVYKDEEKRDSIYFPEGRWTDYWSGETLEGPRWVNHYPAPLDKLPLFVREGAILPMYPAMLYDNQRRADTLTLDVYPAGHSSFNLYEDDGLTRKYREGEYATTLIESQADATGITLRIHPVKGHYNGIYTRRVYLLDIHSRKPASLTLNGIKLKPCRNLEAFEKSTAGWYYDPTDRTGILHVKTGWEETDRQAEVAVQL